jgi:hypothetical protein
MHMAPAQKNDEVEGRAMIRLFVHHLLHPLKEI